MGDCLNIAICDDDILFLEYIKEELVQVMTSCHIQSQNIDVFESGEDLLEGEYQSYDVIILDMEMKQLNGYEVARRLRKECPEQIIAFCSGVQMPLPEYFEVQPYRYLIKQNKGVLHEKLCEVIYKAKEKESGTLLDVIQTGKVYRVNINDILYICRMKHGSKVYLFEKSEEVLSKQKLDEIYQLLSTKHFAFAHNSYIVNLAAVVKIDRLSVYLKNNEQLTISRAYSKTFHEAFVSYIGMNYLKGR